MSLAPDLLKATLFEDQAFEGEHLGFELHGVWYTRVRELAFDRAGMDDETTSFRLEAGPSTRFAGGDLILFDDDRFRGRFQRWHVPNGATVSPSYIGRNFDDLPTSGLLVRHAPNETLVPLGSTGLPGQRPLRAQINDVLATRPDLAARGRPIITWDLWPEGPEDDVWHPRRQERFVLLRIPVLADVPGWLDYEAELRFWILPAVRNDELVLTVEHFNVWVQGGLAAEQVRAKISPRAREARDQLAAGLQTSANGLNAFGPVRSVYLLPGDGSPIGHTDDDVTLVLVR